MKEFDKDQVYKKITTFQKAIKKFVDKDILAHIIEDIIRRLNSDILPDDWFFKSAKNIQKQSSKKLIEYSSQIRSERDKIKYTIEQFWELPEDIRKILLDMWPSEYRKYLNKKPINTGDEIIDDYISTDVANIILAKKYKSTPGTIYKYAGEPREK